MLWFRILGVGLFFPKFVKLYEASKVKIEEVAKEHRPGCSKVAVLNRRSRASDLTCCGEGMIAVDVYYPGKGLVLFKNQYRAHPSFVCKNCFNHSGPADYDPPNI